MATCGNCKATGVSVEHVRECFTSRRGQVKVSPAEVTGFAQQYVESRDFSKKAEIRTVPDSMYALDTPDGLAFYEVKTGKGRWDGYKFVSRLLGSPGDFRRIPVKGSASSAVMGQISLDPKAFAIRFSKEFTVCAACGAALTDPESRELGLGPTCVKKF